MKEAFFDTNTLRSGSVWDMTFSRDPQQTYIYYRERRDEKIASSCASTLEVADLLRRRRTSAGPVLRRPQPRHRFEGQPLRDRDLHRRARSAVPLQGCRAGDEGEQGVLWPGQSKVARTETVTLLATAKTLEARMKRFRAGTGRGDVCSVAVLMAQTKINPTDPQPTCNMCPATYIPVDELQAYTKKAIAEKLTDQQVRDIDIGKAHVGIGMVYRGKLDKPGARLGRRARSRQRGLPHHRRLGDAGARSRSSSTGSAVPRPADRRRVQRPGQQRRRHPQRRDASTQGRRRGRHSGGHRPLVHEDRRSHHLSDGSHRSRQGHAAADEAASKAYLQRPARPAR